MQPLTPGAQIDELRAALRISEQRRQRAEARLADRERQLGTASAVIAAQDQRIDNLRAELELREASTSPTSLNAGWLRSA
jgi:chromosome segregation ATPase